MKTRDPGSEDETTLAAEAANQLHHRDDKRDAASMRIEELVREVEYDEDSHEEASRASPLVLVWIVAGVISALALAAWLHSMWL